MLEAYRNDSVQLVQMVNGEEMAIDANAAAEEEVDIDMMSSCASRTTLAGMQQLWRQHAAIMDAHGKQCAETLYGQHSQALQDLAAIKQFDLKSTLAVVNTFVGAVRDKVLAVFTSTRQQDDQFAQQLYQTTRTAFTRNLKAAMEARDAWYQEKVKSLQSRHAASLAAARAAAAVEVTQLKTALQKAAEAAAQQALDMPRVAPTESRAGAAAEARPEVLMIAAEPGSQVETLQLALEEAQRDVANWKGRWSVESSKADAIKRECMQVVQRCEDHILRLQQQHVADLNQRDSQLQRCKEAMALLEAKLAA